MPADTHAARMCQDFVVVVEALLVQRRASFQDDLRLPAPSWTRDELCDLAYASYKALVRGQVSYPPKRATVMAVAEYLSCTPAEYNRLLTAAGLAPAPPDLKGEALVAVLTVAQRLVSQLPFPGVLVTRDWTIHGWNSPMQRLMRLRGEDAEAWPPEQRSILHLLFNPVSPVYDLLGGGDVRWKQLVRRDMLNFKRHNHLSRHEVWFEQRLQSLMNLPYFAEFWQDIDAYDSDESEHQPHEIECVNEYGETVIMNVLWISVTDLDYPQVLAFAPLNHKKDAYISTDLMLT